MKEYRKEVRIIEQNDRKIYGTMYWPEGEKCVPLVILSHGYNGSGDDFESFGVYLASQGIAAYCFDFCGGSMRSKSSGKTSEMSIYTEKEDLKTVVCNAAKWEEIDVRRIVLFGASQGGFITALAGEELRDEIQGMILLFPAFCIPDDWEHQYIDENSIPEQFDFRGMFLGRSFVQSVHGFDNKREFGTFDKPVLFLHGDKDEIVSYQYSLELEQQYKSARTILFHGEGHGFSEEAMGIVQSIVNGYLKDTLHF